MFSNFSSSHSPKKMNEIILYYYFWPKDLKWENKGLYYVKYPLINVIKCLHFFDSTHVRRLTLLLKFTDL